MRGGLSIEVSQTINKQVDHGRHWGCAFGLGSSETSTTFENINTLDLDLNLQNFKISKDYSSVHIKALSLVTIPKKNYQLIQIAKECRRSIQ